jgi:hypothetical protein
MRSSFEYHGTFAPLRHDRHRHDPRPNRSPESLVQLDVLALERLTLRR